MSDDRTILVQLSGGAGSTLALHRCIEEFGRDRVVPIFADTRCESPDLYQLLDAIEDRFGVEIVRLVDERDIWDAFDAAKAIVIQQQNMCIASRDLKIKRIAAWIKEHHTPETAVIATGLDWLEQSRIDKFDSRWKPFDCIHPLTWPKRLGRCEIIEQLTALGLPTPEAYEHGFAHNNCGGCCVMAGIGQWTAVHQIYPDRFAYHERREKEWREKTGSGFAVLRDSRGGTVRPYTLRELREDIEAGNRVDAGDWRSLCQCFNPDGLTQSVFDFMETDE